MGKSAVVAVQMCGELNERALWVNEGADPDRVIHNHSTPKAKQKVLAVLKKAYSPGVSGASVAMRK